MPTLPNRCHETPGRNRNHKLISVVVVVVKYICVSDSKRYSVLIANQVLPMPSNLPRLGQPLGSPLSPKIAGRRHRPLQGLALVRKSFVICRD
jgi:hypothetical protein